MGHKWYGHNVWHSVAYFLQKDSKPKQNILAHSNEILTCDWNKYNEFIIATGSVDRTVKIWVKRQLDLILESLTFGRILEILVKN